MYTCIPVEKTRSICPKVDVEIGQATRSEAKEKGVVCYTREDQFKIANGSSYERIKIYLLGVIVIISLPN